MTMFMSCLVGDVAVFVVISVIFCHCYHSWLLLSFLAFSVIPGCCCHSLLLLSYKRSGPISADEKIYVKQKCEKESKTKRKMRKEKENQKKKEIWIWWYLVYGKHIDSSQLQHAHGWY